MDEDKQAEEKKQANSKAGVGLYRQSSTIVYDPPGRPSMQPFCQASLPWGLSSPSAGVSTVVWLAVVVLCRDIGGGRELVMSVLC
jgi:hypothetical protein